jgi:opacity protein-like surface antigen
MAANDRSGFFVQRSDGWAFGGGLEYAFLSNCRPKSNISMSTSAASTPARLPSCNNVSFKESIVRGGLNYKFSGPIF